MQNVRDVQKTRDAQKMRNVLKLKTMEAKTRQVLCDGEWKEMKLAAFIGVELAEDGTVMKFGVGVSGDDYEELAGSASPQSLIAAWRGMLVVDSLVRMEGVSETLSCALTVGRRHVDDFVLDNAIELFDGQHSEILALRIELLERPIPAFELDRVLKICNSDNGITVDVVELKRECAAGAIKRTEEVSRTITLAVEREWDLQCLETLIQAPLEDDNSFLGFCRQAKVKRLCTNAENPQLVELKTIDQLILRASLIDKKPMPLYCADHFPDPEAYGHPVIELPLSLTRIVIVDAVYDQGVMYLDIMHVDHDEPYSIDDAICGWAPGETVERIRLGSLLSASPRCVGIAVPDSELFFGGELPVPGYSVLSLRKLFWRRMKRRFFGGD